jgi:hypothetical protein
MLFPISPDNLGTEISFEIKKLNFYWVCKNIYLDKTVGKLQNKFSTIFTKYIYYFPILFNSHWYHSKAPHPQLSTDIKNAIGNLFVLWRRNPLRGAQSSRGAKFRATRANLRSFLSVPPCGPDVLFVLDSTGSVRLVYEEQKKYILDVAQQMEIAPNGQHVGLILYSSRLRQRIVVGLDQPQSKDQFLKRVSGK